PLRLGGVANWLKSELSQHLSSEIRTVVLGHVQRGGTPTAYDRVLATSFGTMAAGLVARKKFGHMVALQNQRLTSVPLEQVANQTRTVPPDAMGVLAATAVGTSFGVANMDLDAAALPEGK